MNLPVPPPVKPMLAKAIAGIPERDDLVYEPKWDGFRCIIFRDGGDIVLGSRNEKPLTRYFPELVPVIAHALPERCVVDGEIIVITDDHLDFDGLQQRIHPASSRVELLAATTPASFVAFDLLALDDLDLRPLRFTQRRAALEQIFENVSAPLHLTATTADRNVAARWFEVFEGAGLDGLIAKPIDDPYLENKRAQFKIKHVRTADVVMAGYRPHKDGNGVGSLLLGLYDAGGQLQHVGVAASFTAKRRTELVDELAPLQVDAMNGHPWREWAEAGAHADGRMPGAPHRWSGQKDHSWIPLRPERVAEVKYGSTLNGRFREVTKLLRWRPDKSPKECTFDQMDEPVPTGVEQILRPQ